MRRRREEEEWAPRPADLVKVGVALLLDTYLIRGVVHLPPEVARFSDAWESVLGDPRLFIPVTDAEVTTRDGEAVMHTAFIHVRKSEVKAASPLSETRGAGPS
jgi:hypothetical protein